MRWTAATTCRPRWCRWTRSKPRGRAHRGWAGGGAPALARAPLGRLAKSGAAVPERLRPFALEPSTRAAPRWNIAPDGLDMAQVRHAIRARHTIALGYRDEQDRLSERTVWPFAL